jgi:uncharacterized protein (TIGR02246 family)
MLDTLAPLQSVLVGADDPEIVTLEAALRDAQLSADVEALAGLISDDLLFTGPDGQLATKAQDLAAHRSGTVRIREHTPIELRIRRLSPDAALVALRAHLTVDVHGVAVQGAFRYTRVWSREQGRWCVAGGHVAASPEPTA